MKRVIAFAQLSRAPFLTVGVFPVILGIVLALYAGYPIIWPVAILAVVAVIFIMLATYYHGEFADFDADSINVDFNKFSGGSRMIVTGVFPQRFPLILSYLSIAVAIVIGLIIQFGFKTGVFTIHLGIFGLLSAFFYSAKPIQLSRRGLGEIFIAICYGWLTVNTGYYLMSQKFDQIPSLIAIPIAISIFLVILINEFPDIKSDSKVGKRNLVVILGLRRASLIYLSFIGINLALLIVVAFICRLNLFGWIPLFFPILLGISNMSDIAKQKYLQQKPLEAICGKTILFNLLISVSFIIIFLFHLTI